MPVYDDQQHRSGIDQLPDDDELRQITGIGADEEGTMDREAHNGVARDILNRENNAAKGNNTDSKAKAATPDKLKSAEGAAAGTAAAGGQLGKGFTGKAGDAAAAATGLGFMSSARRMFFGTKTRRRSTIGGGIATILVGGLIGLVSFTAPLVEPIHLAEILAKNFTSIGDAGSSRFGAMLKYAGAKSYGETRLSLKGKVLFRNTIKQLNDVGVEFQTNARDGIRTMTIDSSQLEDKFPEIKNMLPDERKAFIADKLGVSADDMSTINGDKGKFALSAKDFKMTELNKLVRNSVSLLGKDKGILTWMRGREMAKFYDVHNLFHPIKNAKSKAANKITEAAQERANEERVTENEKAVDAKAASSTKALAEKVKGNSATKVVNGALVLTAVACLVRSAAEAAVTFNHDAVVVPATVKAVSAISIGGQEKAGQDINMNALAGYRESQINSKGQDIWSAKALQATAGTAQTGADMPTSYASTFAGDATASKMRSLVHANSKIYKLACSKVGIIIQGVVGAMLAAVEIAAGPVDGGTTWAAFAASTAAKFAAIAAAMSAFNLVLTQSLKSGAVVPKILSGPLGGNILAYGAREAANVVGSSFGGFAVSAAQEASINQQENNEANQEWQSKSFFAKIFDAKDYRSVTGHLADSISPNILDNFRNAASMFIHMGSTLTGAFGSLVPAAHAADTPYKWPFAKITIPDSLMEKYPNPYENAAVMEKVLNSSAGDGYVKHAYDCFGVNVTKDSEGWNVTPDHEVSITSDAYQNGTCDDISGNYGRLSLFVADNTVMNGADCWKGDEQACQDMGYTSNSGDDTTGGGDTSGQPTPGSAKEIAAKLLKNKNVSYQYDAKQDVTLASEGKNGTCNKPIDPRLLKIAYDIASNGHTLSISALESHCTGHMAGSQHYLGEAIDIASIDGHVAYEEIAKMWPLISGDAKDATFLQRQCNEKASIPSGMRWIDGDVCNPAHQHIDFQPL